MDESPLLIPADIIPLFITRADFRTFVKWTMVNSKWSRDSFRYITAVDSYFCHQAHTAQRLPTSELQELPKYLHKNIKRFENLSEFSLACRWWISEQFLTRHVRVSSPSVTLFPLQARSDVAWVPTLFPLARLNAHRLTRLEIQDYDGMSDGLKTDPIDTLISLLGPQLKELLLLNVWITDTTVDSISKLPASLEVFSVEGSSFPERLNRGRNQLIHQLLAAKSLSTVRAIRLTWSIVTPIISSLPNIQTFPNVRFLDLGVSLMNGKHSNVHQWQSFFVELSERLPGIQTFSILNKTEDLLCSAVESTAFSAEILDLFSSRGFVPELYADMNYFEGSSLRDMRLHPIVAAFRAGNISAARLLLDRGFLSSELSLNQKMMFLCYWSENHGDHRAPKQLEFLTAMPLASLCRLLPAGQAAIQLFCSSNLFGSRIRADLTQFLSARPDLVDALQLGNSLQEYLKPAESGVETSIFPGESPESI